MAEPAKRKRSSNFSQSEKELLLNIIAKYKNTIENKTTNAVTWKNKDDAWNSITLYFNAQCPNGLERNKESLKNFYEGMKKKVRQKAAVEKRKLFKTGGGTNNEPTLDNKDDLILSLINKKTVYGFENLYDDDDTTEHVVEPTHEVTPAIQAREEEKEELEGEAITIVCNENGDWSNVCPQQLKTPKIPKLTVNNSNWSSRRRPIISQQPTSSLHEKYEELANKKLELVNLQIDRQKSDNDFAKLENEKKLRLLDLQLKKKLAK